MFKKAAKEQSESPVHKGKGKGEKGKGEEKKRQGKRQGEISRL